MSRKTGITRKDFLKKSAKSAAGASLFSSLWKENEKQTDSSPNANGSRFTFQQPKFTEVDLGEIVPAGWLKHQLQIMREGTTGHLDEVHEKISEDNGWLGGRGDDWEETPYWLDGAVPLAYLLDDQPLKEKVRRYIDWVIENQRASGYFGPITDYERKTGKEVTRENPEDGEDWWPKMVMLKVLKQYYTATKDDRVIPFMSRYFKYQRDVLDQCPIGHWTEWAKSRGADNVMMAQWLYQQTGDPFLIDLANTIEQQSYNWSEWLGNRDWVMWADAYQGYEGWMRRHAVNVSMALKAPAINYQRTGDGKFLQALETGFQDLMQLHGLPYGIFSGDEDLHGNDPSQGVELCAVVETLYSLEQNLAITGNPAYADAIERIAYNVLPAQTTDDYNARQYFQIANQIHIKRGVFNFSLPFEHEMNNVLGMRSGYTCCLANMHQGWPKFTHHLWYKTPDNGLAAFTFAPNTLTTEVGQEQTTLTIEEETDYPFDDTVSFRFSPDQPVAFPLKLRIPGWCTQAAITLNGRSLSVDSEDGICEISREWKEGDRLRLQLPMEIATSTWGRNSRAVERGPLVYALRLEERWEQGHHPEEGDYWSVFTDDEWNYGLLKEAVDQPANHFHFKKAGPAGEQFIWNLNHVPGEILTTAKKIPDWKIVNDVAPVPVTDRTGIYRGPVINSREQIRLVPIGCTKIRVVAFPVVP